MRKILTGMLFSVCAISTHANDWKHISEHNDVDQDIKDLQKSAETGQSRPLGTPRYVLNTDEDVDVDVSKRFTAKNDTEKRSSKWKYKKGYDEVEGDVITFSYLVSDNEENTGAIYGKQKAAVVIRNVHDTGFFNDEILIGFDKKGQVEFCIDSCWLRVKFDDKPAKWYKAEYDSPALYTIASSKDYVNDNAKLKYDDDFLLNLYNSKKMLVKLPVFDGNTITYRFNLKGLDKSRMGVK